MMRKVKQFTNAHIKSWLYLAKIALYEAEDVLDKISTEDSELRGGEPSRSSMEREPRLKRIKSWFSSAFMSRYNSFEIRIASKLRDVHAKLEACIAKKEVLGLVGIRAPRTEVPQQQLTNAFVDESCVYGRNKKMEQIVEMLLSPVKAGDRKLGVIEILGMDGLGKTTLAKLVYNDSRVKDAFPIRS